MTRQRRLARAGTVPGVLLTLTPAYGLLGTVFGMMHAFSTLGNSGIGAPQILSDGVGTTLLSTAVRLGLPLPQTVVNAALEVDGASAMPGE